MDPKLTKPQINLLRSLSEQPRYVSAEYPPLMKLMALGFVEEKDGRFSTVTYLTDAGRTAYAEHKGGR